MATARTLAVLFALLGTGGTTVTHQDFVARPDAAQRSSETSLACEPGAVSIDITRKPGVRFERIERPSWPFPEPREFIFTHGPIRRVKLFLSATLPEGSVGRSSEAKLEVVAQTSSSATDATVPEVWWRLAPADSASFFDHAAESLLLDAKTLGPCFNGDECKFADITPAADSATAMLVLGFTRDLGGANANNWEHAELALDFRQETPSVVVAVDCGYNEGGGACTAFDSGEMPRSELSCAWDTAVSDFACTEESDVLGHRDFQLLSGRPGASRDGEVPSLDVAARRLAGRAPGGVEIVTGLGRVRHVQDVSLGSRRIMVLSNSGRFYVVDRTADGIGSIRTVQPQPLVPSTDSLAEVVSSEGWTDVSERVFRAGEMYRDAEMVVLRIVEATQYDSTVAPRAHAMYWLALHLTGAELTSAALTAVDPGSYVGCGRQGMPEAIVAVGRIGRSFDATVTVQPATSMSADEQLSWGLDAFGDDVVDCRRPGRVRWRDGKFDVRIDDRACRAAQAPRFVVLGLDGSIRLSAKFPAP